MNIRDAIQRGKTLLEESSALPKDVSPLPETPFLDASVLLAWCLKISKEKLLASWPDEVPPENLEEFFRLLEKRKDGVPVAYLTNAREFFGREFFVDSRVLVPRPDTETLVEAVLEFLAEKRPADGSASPPGPEPPDKLLDVCTGTGCVPLTLALEAPELFAAAADISPLAEEVFRINARRFGLADMPFFLSDLLESVPGKWDIITGNPPYLTAAEMEEKVRQNWPEPALALDGGKEGLDLLFRLIDQSAGRLNPGGLLILEASPAQMPALKEKMGRRGFSGITVIRDLAGRERIIRGTYGAPFKGPVLPLAGNQGP